MIHISLRCRIPFRSVNHQGQPDHDSGLQRHHLLPLQLLGRRCFGAMFGVIGSDSVGFNDFRENGLLLPSSDESAVRLDLPLHRGPHRAYNTMVIERVGQVERTWSRDWFRHPEIAARQAVMRLGLIQRALRRRLLDRRGRRISLNRKDPLGRLVDFAELDAMADMLWGDTEEIPEA